MRQAQAAEGTHDGAEDKAEQQRQQHRHEKWLGQIEESDEAQQKNTGDRHGGDRARAEEPFAQGGKVGSGGDA